MDVYEAIAARKTIRDFAALEIDSAMIEKLVAAGMQAPTNNHMREWHFIILQDKNKRKTLLDQVIHPVDERGAVDIVNDWGLVDESQRRMYIENIPRQYAMLFQAGCLMLPCFRQTSDLIKPRDMFALNPFASIWCCIENILIAAAAEGIFGVTRIPFEEERTVIKQFLNIPTDYEVPCYLALGYPTPNARRAAQVDINLQERIHLNGWPLE